MLSFFLENTKMLIYSDPDRSLLDQVGDVNWIDKLNIRTIRRTLLRSGVLVEAGREKQLYETSSPEFTTTRTSSDSRRNLRNQALEVHWADGASIRAYWRPAAECKIQLEAGWWKYVDDAFSPNYLKVAWILEKLFTIVSVMSGGLTERLSSWFDDLNWENIWWNRKPQKKTMTANLNMMALGTLKTTTVMAAVVMTHATDVTGWQFN